MPRVRGGNKVFFEEAGAAVFLVGPEVESSKVRAVLNSDGSGSVALLEAPPDPDWMSLRDHVSDTMFQLDYFSDSTWPLLPAVAKFWFQHDLGPLVVCPKSSAIRSVYQILCERQSRVAWAQYRHNLAFVFPLGGGAKSTKNISVEERRTYGNSRAKRIYLGGGPCILPQSDCLTINVLKKLGYLDDSMNSDLNEGLLVFLNDAHNKRSMRKAEAMPETGDSCDEIQAKINHTLVSGLTEGIWSQAPRDTAVRQYLVAKQFLQSEEAEHEVVLMAMQDFSKQHALPLRRSYNAYVWQIKHFLCGHDPSRREWLLPSSLLQ